MLVQGPAFANHWSDSYIVKNLKEAEKGLEWPLRCLAKLLLAYLIGNAYHVPGNPCRVPLAHRRLQVLSQGQIITQNE